MENNIPIKFFVQCNKCNSDNVKVSCVFYKQSLGEYAKLVCNNCGEEEDFPE